MISKSVEKRLRAQGVIPKPLLTDEEIRKGIQDYNATLGQCCEDGYFDIHADSFNVVAKAQLKKVVEWMIKNKIRTEWSAKTDKKWQALLEEVKE